MKKIIYLLLMAMFTLGLVGCGSNVPAVKPPAQQQMTYSENTVGEDARLTEENQRKLITNQPPTKIDFSNERANLNRRTKELSDPNKIGYVYLVSYGKVMTFYTIKGKVSSMQSRLTTNYQIVKDPNYHSGQGASMGSLLMESPDFDGTYGPSEQGIFFYTTDDVLVEWSGEYMYSAQPLKLTTQPELVRTIQ